MPMTTTTRVTPSGRPLEIGDQTLIAFADDPDISFWEKSVQPPGIDGGDAVDTTTMHNTTWRTMAPRRLKTATSVKGKAGYDPVVYDQIIARINDPGYFTVKFPNNDTLDFCGFLKSFTPAELQDGTFPESDFEIVVTNTDPTTGAEVAPNYKTSLGTD